MGFSGSVANNYASLPYFAVFFDEYAYFGNITFNPNVANWKSVAQLPSNTDWRISGVSSIQVSGSAATNFDYPVDLIFDIGSDNIGFPLAIFNDIMTKLKNLDCSSATKKPMCYTVSSPSDTPLKLGDLPNISITINTQTIIIPPQVYVEDATSLDAKATLDHSITLNLMALDQSLTYNQYVTRHTIVLLSWRPNS